MKYFSTSFVGRTDDPLPELLAGEFDSQDATARAIYFLRSGVFNSHSHQKYRVD